MGGGRAKDPQNGDEGPVSARTGEPPAPNGRHEQQPGHEVLVEGHAQTRVPGREPAVENGQERERQAGAEPPEHPAKDRIGGIEARNDERDPGDADQGIDEALRLPSLPGHQRLEEGGEDREARVGQQADGDGGDLDGLEEHRPVGGQDQAAEGEQKHVAPPRDAEGGPPPRGHDGGQGQAGEQDPTEDDGDGGPGEPFSEQTGKAEEKDGEVDLGEAAGARRHAVIIFLFLAI